MAKANGWVDIQIPLFFENVTLLFVFLQLHDNLTSHTLRRKPADVEQYLRDDMHMTV